MNAYQPILSQLPWMPIVKLPRYRCHLGCILPEIAAISLPTGWGNSFSLLEGYRYARSLASQLRSSLVYLVEEDVRCHNIAAVWVAFFSRQQRYCC